MSDRNYQDTDLTDPHGEAEMLRAEVERWRTAAIQKDKLHAAAMSVVRASSYENEAIRDELEAITTERDALRAEVEQLRIDAERYRYLRERDLETISAGGVFAGMTPRNVVLNGEDLDHAVDAALKGDDHEWN
ncbi:hypothetical protein SDC9_25111 [bioreactor metagenome]|uniref:Ead/Ea22-like family protein n=1 Tax=bioreactor metagenome TaxID=1076179 RepID=A0A644UJR7_9ZZZZ